MWNTLATHWQVNCVPHTTIGGASPKPNPNMLFTKNFHNFQSLPSKKFPDYSSQNPSALRRHQRQECHVFAPSFTKKCPSGEHQPEEPVQQPPQQQPQMTNNDGKRRRKGRKKKKGKRCAMEELCQLSTVEVETVVESDSGSSIVPSACSYMLDLFSLLPEDKKDEVRVDKGAQFCLEVDREVGNGERGRFASVSESEDSFIVFDGACEDEDDESEFCQITSEDEVEKDVSLEDLSFPCKKVRFAVGKDLCEVHPMIKWSYAYQAARKGPWEEYARDRERFRRRIAMVENTLSGILQPKHRAEVFRQRFGIL